MKRLQSRKDLCGYTMMRQVLINLDIINKDYMWLINDIEAYPSNEKIGGESLLNVLSRVVSKLNDYGN